MGIHKEDPDVLPMSSHSNGNNRDYLIATQYIYK